MLCIYDWPSGASGSSSSGGSGGTGSASGASDSGGSGGSGGTGGAGGASGTLHGRCLQRPLHFGLQEELVLHSGLQQVPDALVSGQHVFHGSGRAAEAGQGAEDILQLLTLGVEDVTQAEFLHGDGGENLIDCVFPLDRRVNVGKAGQRHKTISFLNEGARQECASQ